MRKVRKGRVYTALRDLGVRAVDDVFKMAAPLLREATDLKENMQVGGGGGLGLGYIFILFNHKMKDDICLIRSFEVLKVVPPQNNPYSCEWRIKNVILLLPQKYFFSLASVKR